MSTVFKAKIKSGLTPHQELKGASIEPFMCAREGEIIEVTPGLDYEGYFVEEETGLSWHPAWLDFIEEEL